MKRWTCTSCGVSEWLGFYPDCCSYCRGSMICDDGRTTHENLDTAIEDCPEVLHAAAEGDKGAIVALWQERASPSYYDPNVIADLMLQNRVDLMQAIYRDAA